MNYHYRLVGTIFASCVMLAGCTNKPIDTSTAAETPADPAPDPDERFRAIVEESVKNILKDPDSAEFRGLAVYTDRHLACGQVNARNSFGALSGFEDFVADGGSLYLASQNPRSIRRELRKCAAAMRAETDKIREDTVAAQEQGRKDIKVYIANLKKMISDAQSDPRYTQSERADLVNNLERKLQYLENSPNNKP